MNMIRGKAKRCWAWTPALAVLAACLTHAPAAAQTITRDQNQSVAERSRAEYEPNGIRVRSFEIRPRLTTDVAYLDNVFAEESNRDSDAVIGLRSALNVNSTWSRHSVSGGFTSDTLFFTEFGSEDRTSWRGNVEGRLDLGRSSQLGAGALFRRNIAPRTSPETPLASLDLVQETSQGVFVTGAHEFNRLRLSARAERTNFNFGDITTIGGQTLSLDDRERVEWRASGRADYALSPDSSVFVEGGWNQRDFDVIPLSGVARSSTGQTFLAGFRTDVTRLLRGEVSIGYLRQDFQAANVNVVAGLATRIALEYFPTPLTTVRLNAQREIQDTGVDSGAGIFSTNVGLGVDHELLRNLILSASGGYNRQSFRGLPRTDTFYNAEVGARYLINRNLSLGASYRFDHGATNNVAGRDFGLNSFRVSLTVAL
ncbi:MAG: outer membrane beta-barrel protein [Hyphomonadaceae bacterium]|nr:outer membrane beta-barrel protein [Hyphomonadaceae bacterium]